MYVFKNVGIMGKNMEGNSPKEGGLNLLVDSVYQGGHLTEAKSPGLWIILILLCNAFVV